MRKFNEFLIERDLSQIQQAKTVGDLYKLGVDTHTVNKILGDYWASTNKKWHNERMSTVPKPHRIGANPDAVDPMYQRSFATPDRQLSPEELDYFYSKMSGL